MAKIKGHCRICGEFRKFTKEHIPPKKAFNHDPITFESMKDFLGESGRPYSKSPDGMYQYSLCEACNNLTGSWYADDFVKWSHQGHEWLDKLTAYSTFFVPFHLRPLNVIKQTIVMMLAVMDEDHIDSYDYVRRFIHNKEQKYLPPDFRVYVYFTRSHKPRLANKESAIMRVDLNALDYVNAEIARPPFGYCITSTRTRGKKSLAEHQGLFDISWFSRIDYNVWTTEFLRLPIKQVNSPLPLDF